MCYIPVLTYVSTGMCEQTTIYIILHIYIFLFKTEKSAGVLWAGERYLKKNESSKTVKGQSQDYIGLYTKFDKHTTSYNKNKR